ncbi:MAG TPA: hypothetical protein VKQ30_00535 [Ktedonobacterales bacterium]|nr:hypothetical protein [Ktedonobacterales bacterium]
MIRHASAVLAWLVLLVCTAVIGAAHVLLSSVAATSFSAGDAPRTAPAHGEPHTPGGAQ